MEDFKPLISEVLEVDIVEMTDELLSFDAWDSLTILSIIALVSEEYNVELTRKEIEHAETIQGLNDLIDSKR